MVNSITEKMYSWVMVLIVVAVSTVSTYAQNQIAIKPINDQLPKVVDVPKVVKPLPKVVKPLPKIVKSRFQDVIKLPRTDKFLPVKLLAPGIVDVKKIDIDDFKLLKRDLPPRVRPTYRFNRARHVVNGVAMRNRTDGTVHLRGVPARRRVLAALLYWNFLDDEEIGTRTFPALFNGNKVIGRKAADSPDPCWANVVGSHSYVANVTQYIPTTRPNQDYEVVLFFDDLTSTTGQNPWSPSEVQDVRTEGAGLIVIYEERNSGPVYIYDRLNDSMIVGSETFNLLHPSSRRPALFSMLGADGQRGGGHTNTAGNELTFFNGDQIAGPPVTSSDWDGSDGWPLPQLWDTHTHHVRLDGTIANVRYQGGGDCLVPVAFIIDVN